MMYITCSAWAQVALCLWNSERGIHIIIVCYIILYDRCEMHSMWLYSPNEKNIVQIKRVEEKSGDARLDFDEYYYIMDDEENNEIGDRFQI